MDKTYRIEFSTRQLIGITLYELICQGWMPDKDYIVSKGNMLLGAYPEVVSVVEHLFGDMPKPIGQYMKYYEEAY